MFYVPKANPDSVQQRSTAYSYSVTYNHLLNFPQNRLYKSDNSPVIISTKVMNKLATIGKSIRLPSHNLTLVYKHIQ